MRLLLVNEWYNPVFQNLIHFFAAALGDNFSWTGKRWYRKDFLPFSPEEQKTLRPEPEALSDLQKGKYSHVIFSDGTTLLYLSSQLKAKRVVVDSLDYASIPRFYYENADFYFKAQYPKDGKILVKNTGEDGYEASGIHRFSLTPSYKVLNLKTAPSFDRPIDVFFNGSAWPQDRIQLVSKIKSRKSIKFSGGLYNRADLPFNNVVPKELHCGQLGLQKYLASVLGSKVCLNLRGNGENCYRQFEVLHLGSLLLTQETNNHFCHVEAPKDCFGTFDGNILEKAQYYLDHEEERVRIAENGRKFFEEHLHPRKLVQYILETIED